MESSAELYIAQSSYSSNLDAELSHNHCSCAFLANEVVEAREAKQDQRQSVASETDPWLCLTKRARLCAGCWFFLDSSCPGCGLI
ncbi:hypothetical protein SynBIOSU31_01702 [Synechococcus sp. BIOS-U3-1]|nr:hypothetical protein SynBIOSU31_01702 [Synechococcus sp. BIOS-U3-1]